MSVIKEFEKFLSKLNKSKNIRASIDVDTDLLKELYAAKLSLEQIESVSNLPIFASINDIFDSHLAKAIDSVNFNNLYESYAEQSTILLTVDDITVRVYKTVYDMSTAVIVFNKTLSYTEFAKNISSIVALLHLIEHFAKTSINSVHIMIASIYAKSTDTVSIDSFNITYIELNPRLADINDFTIDDFVITDI
jgi:hypothetical protein